MLGYQRYVIVSGSMTGSYDRGSLVFDDVVPARDLKVGDVITYTPPPGSGPTGLVTHRIAAITRDAQGTRYRTKGDANAAADPWTFTLPRRAPGARRRERAVGRLRAQRALGPPRATARRRRPGAAHRAHGPRRPVARVGRRGRAEPGVTRRLLVLGALALVPLGVQPSQATFVASSTTAASTFATAADFNTVAVTLDDPGTPLQGSVALAATASSDRGIERVRFQVSPAGAGTWADACEATAAPYTCAWDTNGDDGLVDVRAVARDTAGYERSATPHGPPRRQHRAVGLARQPRGRRSRATSR